MNHPNLDPLTSVFSGEIILPGDAGYEEASTTIMSKGAPALIVRPINAKEVAAAIKFARDNSLILSIRSGGHSGLGFSNNTGGMVLDLSAMNKVEVIDADKRIVSIESGAEWGEVATTLGNHDLAISSGDTKSVGVGGLTLGGGIGWLVRKVGLALDNLLTVEIVTADGQTVRASKTENPELFWGLRGGGGNFGVATRFEFEAASVKQTYAGSIIYDLSDVEKLLIGWRDTMRAAPEELNSMLMVMPSFGGNPPSAILMCCFDGDEEQGKAAIEPLLHLGTVMKQELKVKPYAEVLEEAHPPHGIKVIAKNVFVQEFNNELIAEIATICQAPAYPVFQIRSLGGAMNRVPADATAFAHRDSEILLVAASFVPETATEDEIFKATEPWRKVAVFGSGVYLNLLSVLDEGDFTEAYPTATFERLTKLKKQYDPNNVFNQNFNIQPAA